MSFAAGPVPAAERPDDAAVVALNAVPIFVLVAVFNNMFSVTSEVPRRLMVTLVVYFIVLVNVARGLREVGADPARADALVRRERRRDPAEGARAERGPVPVHGAADRRPGVGDHRVRGRVLRGSQNGLGSRIVGNIALSNNAEAWAYVLGACLLGLTFYLVALVLERVATPGGVSARERVGA